jgi:23S rRNA (cytosine1962-C5)-methyltransferase
MKLLTDQYELLDFGFGRRLERFGRLTIDRPCPAAESFRQQLPSSLWQSADGRFERDDRRPQSRWVWKADKPDDWTIDWGLFRVELNPSPVGQIGIFPEQAPNWQWIADQVARADRPIKVLNLFGYTGASSLAAAKAGAEVVHIDAARNMVTQARQNGAISGLADAPIRWITEDAVKFVRREIRRGNRYDAVILDPPSYGHGASGQVWRLAQDLPKLLALCAELTAKSREFLLLTCHTPGYDGRKLSETLGEAIGAKTVNQSLGSPQFTYFESKLITSSGAALPSGSTARFPAH